MKNRTFDQSVFRRIQGEDIRIRKETEMKIEADIHQKEAAQTRQVVHHPLRTMVAVCAALLLLCGVAFAAIRWSSRSLVSYEDQDGQQQVNEQLASYAQPVEQSFHGEFLSIDMVDAIFDGNTLVLAWTLTNTSERPIYLYCDPLVNGDRTDMGSYTRVDELFVQPGETIESGISARTDGENYGAVSESCDVELRFTAFATEREVVEIEAMDEAATSANAEAYQSHIDSLLAQGKIPLASDGVIEMSSHVTYHEGMTRSDMLEASGLMEKVDTVEATFSIERNTEAKSALPDGKQIEKENGGYLLRVVQADLGINSATFRLERVFASKEAVEEFWVYYSEKLGPYWGFSFEDETGDIWWSGNGGGSADTEAPQEQPDGTWVWGYTQVSTNLVRVPKTITVIPTRDDPETGEFNVAFEQESITLSFE